MDIKNPPALPRVVGTVATTAPLPANTYNNGSNGSDATIVANDPGVWAIDGYDIEDGDTILVKDEATAANNGLYVVLAAGTAGTRTLLQRDPQMNTPQNFFGVVVPLSEAGATLANTMWICQAQNPVIGTDPITFQEATGGGGGGTPTQIAQGGGSVSVNAFGVVTISPNSGQDIEINGPVAFAGFAATGLPDPVNPQDAATKAYVDASGGSGQLTPVVKTADYSMADNDSGVLADASGGEFTVTLPASPLAGANYFVKKIDDGSNFVTVQQPTGNIEGLIGPLQIRVYLTTIRFIFDGTDWWIV